MEEALRRCAVDQDDFSALEFDEGDQSVPVDTERRAKGHHSRSSTPRDREAGGFAGLAARTGMDERRLRRIFHGHQQFVELQSVDRICVAAGLPFPHDEVVPCHHAGADQMLADELFAGIHGPDFDIDARRAELRARCDEAKKLVPLGFQHRRDRYNAARRRNRRAAAERMRDTA